MESAKGIDSSMVYILAFFTTKSATGDLQLSHSAMHSRNEKKKTLSWIEAKKREKNWSGSGSYGGWDWEAGEKPKWRGPEQQKLRREWEETSFRKLVETEPLRLWETLLCKVSNWWVTWEVRSSLCLGLLGRTGNHVFDCLLFFLLKIIIKMDTSFPTISSSIKVF